MLLMVMEMRMSDWTDFVGVISVCFKVKLGLFSKNIFWCLTFARDILIFNIGP